MLIAVEFLSDLKEYAVVPLENIVDGTIRAKYNKQVWKKLKIRWGRKSYDVMVRGFGSKLEMESICDDLATEAATNDKSDSESMATSSKSINRKHKRSKQTVTAEDISDVLGKRGRNEVQPPSNLNDDSTLKNSDIGDRHTDATLPQENHEASVGRFRNEVLPVVMPNQVNDCEDKVRELELQIVTLKDAKKKYRAKIKSLREDVDALEAKLQLPSKSKLELVEGSGVFIKKSKVAAAKLGANSPSVLARNLFRYLFTSEEIIGKSLMGRSCNANKNVPILPCVNQGKRDALVEFSLASYKLKPASTLRGIPSEYDIQKARILSLLTKLLREEMKKKNL